jgi:putative oxidoreductase
LPRNDHPRTLRPAGLFAAAAIEAELVAGLALALGFMTPVAAAVLVAQAVVIIVQAHLANGFFSTRGGLEFPLVLGAVAMSIGLLSAGAFSLDALLGLETEPALRTLAALIGLIGGFVVLGTRGLTMPTRDQPLGRPR